MKLRVAIRTDKGEYAEAEVPYETGKYKLPEVAPFTDNVVLGPDDGFYVGDIAIDADRKTIYYGHAESAVLNQGIASGKIKLKTKTYTLAFMILSD